MRPRGAELGAEPRVRCRRTVTPPSTVVLRRVRLYVMCGALIIGLLEGKFWSPSPQKSPF